MTGKDPQSQLDSVVEECGRLQEGDARLRGLLSKHGISLPEPPIAAAPAERTKSENDRSAVNRASGPEAKIALFRSLFRDREDVYAVRWEAPGGRAGYIPQADRDWKAYSASKPENRKKVDHKTRKYLPLRDEAVRKHLTGEITVGIYPLMLDETCWFLAVDFDKKSWQLDAAAFLAVCCELAVPASLEGSTSPMRSPTRNRGTERRAETAVFGRLFL